MIATLKAFSILLCYPTEEIRVGASELSRAIADEGLIDEPILAGLREFLSDFGERDLYDLQERYVLLFDRTRSLSLQMFEHVHGESRERGQAMVNLMQLYEQHDLAMEGRELPDFLPMFLEFASTLPLAEASEMLREIAHIVKVLEERLTTRQSAYARIFQGIEAVAGGLEGNAEFAMSNLPDSDPEDLEALDEMWEEAPVTFGPDSPGGSCPAARETLAKMNPGTSGGGDLSDGTAAQLGGAPS